ncbi:MAG: methionine--tRNA ligase [Chloroflexi bacterium HGW-Chloroflexi-5]|jgi:methionyl-tRNA synthetase|nr:MAG: methionine--tRNA ligase [Chloroflexi bacterium HGW-Chloroflexi-5]
MSVPILVSAAWPYANAEIHVGNLTGSYLPADIFARFQRLKGNQVLMVSGSDSHGTPITVRADAEGTTPQAVYEHFHEGFIDLFQQLGLNYDLFTSTHTQNHQKVSQSVFLALKKNGYLYTESQMQWYAPSQSRFLPDRYVEGTCYLCGYENARSDQCDKCGSLLEAERLINPKSKIDGSTPELRSTEHFYIDLAKLQTNVVDFLKVRDSYWRPNVMRQSLGQILADSLHGRAITRDLDWGIPLPAEVMEVGKEWESKRLYVWFEAVIGYLSASIEWGQLAGNADAWRNWWQNPDSRTYYFIGKDNIPFHAVIWPAELIGAGKAFDEVMGAANPQALVLPYDVPANEFMNLEGQKISGSRNWAVWARDFLTRYDPDALRYYLTVNMPESKDTDWDWDEFYHRNNDELVATWGNLANRVLSFCNKYWEGQVPDPGELTDLDKDLIKTIEGGFETVGNLIDTVKLRAAAAEAMRLASEVNKYLDVTAPWQQVKTDKATAARAIFTALKAIDSLKILFAPFLPFTSDRLHGFMGYDGSLFGTQSTETLKDELGEHTVLRYNPGGATGKWEPSKLKAGDPLRQPVALFKKLDISIVEEERARLGKQD